MSNAGTPSTPGLDENFINHLSKKELIGHEPYPSDGVRLGNEKTLVNFIIKFCLIASRNDNWLQTTSNRTKNTFILLILKSQTLVMNV